MEFIKLEDEKFNIKYSQNKPHNKHFPNAKIDEINRNEYKFSSLLTKDEMHFNIEKTYYRDSSSILYGFIKDFPEFYGHNYNNYYHLHIYNPELLILSCTGNRFQGFDFPIKVNLSDGQYFSLSQIYKLNSNNIYIVACKAYMFEMIYRFMKLDYNTSLSKKDINFLNKLDPNKLYNDKFLSDNNIKHNNIVYNNGLINIPIFEKIGKNWVFYRHNFDKYKDKL